MTVAMPAPAGAPTCDYRVFGESLLDAENQLLWWYYANHFEYPPFNYTKARDPRKRKAGDPAISGNGPAPAPDMPEIQPPA